MGAGYPPSPWSLRGQLHASVLCVRLAALPLRLPPGWRPLRLGGRAVVGVVWVHYEPGGVLSYRELMATVLVRRGIRVRPSITHIWVDSSTSRDGGRALWAVPKDLATFAADGPDIAAARAGTPIARATVRPGTGLPVRLPLRFRIVQQRAGAAVISPVRVTARPALCRLRLHLDAGGPLAALAGHRPLLSLSLRDFRMRFGR